MDPAEVAFYWFQEGIGRELIETTISEMWNEGSKWYVVARSRTTTKPRSADNPYETLEIDGVTSEVVPRRGRYSHLMPLSYLTEDFLPFRYTALTCRWCLHKEQKYQEFKEKADKVAKHLQDIDHATRVGAGPIIVNLVEEGAGVIGPSPRTELLGHPHYDTRQTTGCGKQSSVSAEDF